MGNKSMPARSSIVEQKKFTTTSNLSKTTPYLYKPCQILSFHETLMEQSMLKVPFAMLLYYAWEWAHIILNRWNSTSRTQGNMTYYWALTGFRNTTPVSIGPNTS